MALNYGSGQLENLFATPSLVAMRLEDGAKLLDKDLPDGMITVGKSVLVFHEKATVLGETVTVKVCIKGVENNKITLQMKAFDEIGAVGSGEHTCVVVNKQSLLERASRREGHLEKI